MSYDEGEKYNTIIVVVFSTGRLYSSYYLLIILQKIITLPSPTFRPSPTEPGGWGRGERKWRRGGERVE